MRSMRFFCHFLSLALACATLLWAISFLDGLKGAGENYAEHHEATIALCRLIALITLSLGLALTGARFTSPLPLREVLAPLGVLTLPALIAAGTELIIANEMFLSLFTPKGFPVPTSEQVVFPEAGWQGMASTLLAALIAFLAFGWMWWAMRPRKCLPRQQQAVIVPGDGTNPSSASRA